MRVKLSLNKFMSFIFRSANVDNPMSKYITAEQCVPILELVASSHICLRKSLLVKKFIQYIKDISLKGIKRDEWENVYHFFKQNPDDLRNYSLDDAWPVIYDDFAEWVNSKGG